MVIKNTFLSNTDGASVALRKELLEACNLHTILDCPGGTFQGAGVKTVVLVFDKGAPTRKVWYYQLDPGRSLGKTNPLNDADLAEFVALQPDKADSPQSWTVDVATLDPETWDLSVKNPSAPEEAPLRDPPRSSTPCWPATPRPRKSSKTSGGCCEGSGRDFAKFESGLEHNAAWHRCRCYCWAIAKEQRLQRPRRGLAVLPREKRLHGPFPCSTNHMDNPCHEACQSWRHFDVCSSPGRSNQ